MKVNTVEQYKALEYIKQNFDMNYITLELIDNCSIGVTDRQGARMIVAFKNGEVEVI